MEFKIKNHNNIFIMRTHRKKRWDVTHSLTPQPDFSLDRDYKINLPQIPEVKKVPHYAKESTVSIAGRSKKQRMVQQRNTEIQRTNRMLYQKIRKIMQKGQSSQRKIEPTPEDSPLSTNKSYHQFLKTSMKPLSLPQTRQSRQTNNVLSFRSTQAQLNNILDDRPKFAQKYFEELNIARKNMINVHTQQIANLVCYGWKVKVLILNHGQFIVLSAKKGKKQLKKKYIYEKVKSKVENNLQQWASSKFQFQI